MKLSERRLWLWATVAALLLVTAMLLWILLPVAKSWQDYGLIAVLMLLIWSISLVPFVSGIYQHLAIDAISRGASAGHAEHAEHYRELAKPLMRRFWIYFAVEILLLIAFGIFCWLV